MSRSIARRARLCYNRAQVRGDDCAFVCSRRAGRTGVFSFSRPAGVGYAKPKKDGTGLIAAYEILLVSSPVANLIRKGEINQITTAITTGKSMGMVLMDNSLEILAKGGLISDQEACERATNPIAMTQLLSR